MTLSAQAPHVGYAQKTERMSPARPSEGVHSRLAGPADRPKGALTSAADFLASDSTQPIRHEFVHGEVFMMAGGEDRKATVTGNLWGLPLASVDLVVTPEALRADLEPPESAASPAGA